MPVEYYLGAVVGLILLGLLGFSFRSKRASRRGLKYKDDKADIQELTRQMSRIADSLEALVPHLKGSAVPSPQAIQPAQATQPIQPIQAAQPIQPIQAAQPAPAPAKSREPEPVEEKAPDRTALAQKPPAEAVQETKAPEPAEREPPPSVEPAKSGEQTKPHVVLSMFGR